jgi:DNA-binding transcriptional MocR family regulator
VPEQYQVTGDSAASISASIESGVRRGDFVFGDALPPIRILADSLQVSPATVAKAYQELRTRGVVETKGRHGTRIRSRPPIALSRSALRLSVPEGVLDLSAGDPDLRLLPPLREILRAVAEGEGDPQGYGAAVAVPALTEAARARLAGDGVPMADAAVTVTSGALDAIERLFGAHLRPGDAVAVEDPGWAGLFDLVAALGLRAIPFHVDAEGPDPMSFTAALHAGARAAVVTVRAQNPTGATVTADRAAELREILADAPDVLLIEDDHAAELSPVPLACLGPATDRWAFVRSASKPFGPDLRIAIVAGDEVTIDRVVGRMRVGAGWVSTLLQRTLLRLWQDDHVTVLVAAAAADYARRRDALRRELAARGITACGHTGINIWVRVEDETRAVGVLREAGYAVAAGSLFRMNSEPGIRITISRLDDAGIPAFADAVALAVSPARLNTPSR